MDNFKKFILFILLFLSGCSTQIWSSKTSSTTQQAVIDYNQKKVLPNGYTYGEFARSLNLKNQTLKSIESISKKYSCKRIHGNIKDWKTKQNLIYKGKSISMFFFVCPDGSLIRIKPDGNPLDKFRPWPHSSKSVRYPYNGDHKNFSIEAFKVDNKGNAIPKWPKDLNKDLDPDEWANKAHTNFEK